MTKEEREKQAKEFIAIGEAWSRERERLCAQRQAELAKLHYELPNALFDPDDGLPHFPWAWYQGRLVTLRPTEPSGRPNRFGGREEYAWRGLEDGCRPHLLLRLRPSTLPLGIPAMMEDDLPLFYPFQSSTDPELTYCRGPGTALLARKSPRARVADKGWPYPNYPAVLPTRDLAVEGPWPIPYLALLPSGSERALSVQDLPEDGDQFLIVVVTAREKTLGVSLLGPAAEDNSVQVVFVVNPATSAVWSYNQCT